MPVNNVQYALPKEVVEALEKSMKGVQYDNLGGGLFQPEKRNVKEGNRYLLVSLGGTGADVLEYAQKLLMRNLNLTKDNVDQYVRFLAVDTDKTTADRFPPSDFYMLPGEDARHLISNNDASIQEWINPNLVELIKSTPGFLNGDGASAIRQIGRLLLSPPDTVNTLKTAISRRVDSLTQGNMDQLKIFVIAGIAGGTGSGTVVDATYLIHDVMQTKAAASHYEVNGIILLPPTGKATGGVDVFSGNKNGYAALKEIDYFMHLVDRDGVYERSVGHERMTLRENIYNTCYLMDGQLTGMAVGNHHERAVATAARWLLDIMTSSLNLPNGFVRSIDSNLVDAPGKAMLTVQNHPNSLCPRESTYSYAAIGNHQTIVPLDLVKTYVAKKLLDRMYGVFNQVRNVNEAAVEDFLKKVTMPLNGYNRARQEQQVDNEAGQLFRVRGPYFVINLLAESSRVLQEDINEMNARLVVLDRERKVNQKTAIRDRALKLNNELFLVYTQLLESLKKVLDQGYNIFIDTDLTKDRYGSTYSFTPIQDNTAALPSTAVNYLDSLVNGLNIQAEIQGMMNRVLTDQSGWSVRNEDGVLTSDAGEVFRKHWADRINALVEAGLEDLLIKHYSDNPNARYNEADPDKTKVDLEKAAREIVNQTFGAAGQAKVMADTQPNFPVGNFYGEQVLLIPVKAPHLKAAVEAEVGIQGLDVLVADSEASDMISAYALYTGLPAYLFRWTARGEAAYEKALADLTAGMHLSETAGGKLWGRFADLMPTSGVFVPKDPHDPTKPMTPREQAIVAETAQLFERAKCIGLTELLLDELSGINYSYTLFSLDEAYRPDPEFLKKVRRSSGKAKDDAVQAFEAAAQEKADALYELLKAPMEDPAFTADDIRSALTKANVVFNGKAMSFGKTVRTADGYNGDWPSFMAARLLRYTVDYVDIMEETVAVMEKVYDKVEKQLSRRVQMKTFAEYLMTDMFTYDAELYSWQYLSADGTELYSILDMEPFNEVMETAKYYFLFEAFHNRYDEVTAQLNNRFQDAWNGLPGLSRADQVKLIVARNAKAQALKDNELANIVNPRERVGSVTNPAFKNQAKLRGYDTDAMVKFYQAFLTQLTVSFSVR